MEQTINQVTVEDCRVHEAGQGEAEFCTWIMIWIHDDEDMDFEGVRMATMDGVLGNLITWHFGSNETDHSKTLPRYMAHVEVTAALRNLLVELGREFPAIRMGIPHDEHVPDSVPTVWAFASSEDPGIEESVRKLLERLRAEEQRQLRIANPNWIELPDYGEEAS